MSSMLDCKVYSCLGFGPAAKPAAYYHALSERNAGQIVYEWDQTVEEVNVYVRPPAGVTARSIACDIQPRTLAIGLKGNPPYLAGALPAAVKLDSSFWTLEDGTIHVTLQKAERARMWPSVFEGHEQLDPLQQDSEQKRLMLERFQQENPGFDFSGAQFNGSCPNPSSFLGGMRHS
eukprot:jgi/Chlat1/2153/Chrsp17S02732